MELIGEPTLELSVEVDAPADQLWSLVTDVSRIPEWSPVCRRCAWIGDRREPVAGARFRGFNRLNGVRWSRECVVTEAATNEVFAFSSLFRGQESTRWRYRIEPHGSKTAVHEAYEVVMVPPWIRVLRLLPGIKAKGDRDAQWNLRTSLDRLKAIAEGAPA